MIDISTGHNTGLAKVVAQYSEDIFMFNQPLVLRLKNCGENRRLRQVRNLYQKLLMKSIKILFLYALFTGRLCAQNYSVGDTLYVVAINGLNLRESPNLTAPKVAGLNNGEKVVTIESEKFIEDKIDGFHGQWVRVHSIDSNLDGFVFDAFISRYPALTQFASIQGFIDNNWNDHDLYSFLPKMLEEYTLKVFKPEGCEVYYSNGSDGESNYSISIRQLNKNATLIKHGASEGSGTELELLNPRISEVYYLIKNIVKFIPPEILTLDDEKLKAEEDYGQVYAKAGDYPFVIRIAYKGDNLVSIIFFNACC